ncbi:hypothetical protein RF11_07418 [Thelohanellus kitauei]|uniref:Uncharacterized protein n=1 Tax=Thelohanellus kitauei TaxID=669202 RepID=A0A0C2MQM2_THEKT|nr:hypothetical protein RF11_07418 [Thelohanellus kitauei]
MTVSEYIEAPQELMPSTSVVCIFLIKSTINVGCWNHQIFSNMNGLIVIMKYLNQYDWNASDSYVYISNNHGFTFSKYAMIWNGKPVYVTTITSIQDFMFCQSEINSSFFYLNADLQISY